MTDLDPGEVLCAIRQLFSDGQSRDRDTALRELSAQLGYERLGPRMRVMLASYLLAAVRRGILQNERGELSLLFRSIENYYRDFLKVQFLASVGRTWTDREEASRSFARWLGFSRTGPIIENTVRSLINGLLRENRLETDGSRIRRS